MAENFADFVGDSNLVAHNAGFDRSFINMELGLCRLPEIGEHRFVDTLLLARRRHPNGPNSLDALCARYGIDNSMRTKHGALLDAEILAEVYLELLGGRQATFLLTSTSHAAIESGATRALGVRPRPLLPRLSAGGRTGARRVRRNPRQASRFGRTTGRHWKPLLRPRALLKRETGRGRGRA